MSSKELDNRFLRTNLLLGEDNLEKLKKAKVTIIGLGAVGSFVGEALVRSGVGNLRLIDFDKISLTNINRCLLALESNIGRYKVDVAKERYQEINPNAKIEAMNIFAASDSFDKIIGNDPHVIIDAIDSVNPKVQILMQLANVNIPVISSMGAALKTDPLKVRVSSIHQTKNCTLAKWVRKNLRKRGVQKEILCVYSEELPKSDAIFESNVLNETREYDRGRERHTMGSMIVIPGIFGLTIANLAINKIIEQN